MSYTSEVLADAPLAYYRLNEASGTTLTDASGNARNGSYTATGITLGSASLLTSESDPCATFSGGSASTPYGAWMNTSTEITLEAWVNFNGVAANQGIVGRWSTGGNQALLWLSGGKITFSCMQGAGQANLSHTATITAGTTYHVAAAYNSVTGESRISVNGVVQTGGGVGSIPASTGPLQLGTFAGGYLLQGRLDEVAYYGTTLSAARLTAHYNAGVGPVPVVIQGQPFTVTASALDGTVRPYPINVQGDAFRVTATALDGTVGGAPMVVAGQSFSVTAIALDGAPQVAAPPVVVETSTQYANLGGYNYHGESEVDYDPPVAPSPARIKPTPIPRVHQSLPVPTLVNGRPV